MTAAEKEMHERAVRLRKMTDEQLCGYIDNLMADPTRTAADPTRIDTRESDIQSQICEARDGAIRIFLEAAEKARGIGKGTMLTLRKVAAEQGLISYE